LGDDHGKDGEEAEGDDESVLDALFVQTEQPGEAETHGAVHYTCVVAMRKYQRFDLSGLPAGKHFADLVLLDCHPVDGRVKRMMTKKETTMRPDELVDCSGNAATFILDSTVSVVSRDAFFRA
jgi:hypothetical protein